MTEIIVITGEKRVGKSYWVEWCSQQLIMKGLDVAGIFSPGRIVGVGKKEIWVKDIRSGESKCLAVARDTLDASSLTPFWQFFPESLEWGNQKLLMSVPCDVLMIDELGLLEFNYDQGWLKAFEVLRKGKSKTAIITIRPQLLHKAQYKLGSFKIIELDELRRAENKKKIEACLQEIEKSIETKKSNNK